MENHGKEWKIMETYGKSWKTMENHGNSWKPMENHGKQWKIMETYGKSWKTMENHGNLWKIMETMENHGNPWKNHGGKRIWWFRKSWAPLQKQRNTLIFWWRAPIFTQLIFARFYFFCFVFEPSTYRTLVLQIFTSLLGIKNDFIPSKQGFQKAKEDVESYAQTWHSYIATSLYIGMIK